MKRYGLYLIQSITILVLSFSIGGCCGMVGGKCEYKKVNTVVVIDKITDDRFEGYELFPRRADKPRKFVAGRENAYFDNVTVGEMIPASRPRLVKGTCTPPGDSLDLDRHYWTIKQQAIVFSKEGKLASDVQASIDTVASAFGKLLANYPDSKILLVALVNNGGSDEFSKGVAATYYSKVKTRLAAAGIEDGNLMGIAVGKSDYEGKKTPLGTNRVIFRIDLGIDRN